MKSIAALLYLLHYFYVGIQCDKTRYFVHGEVSMYSMKYTNFRRGA